MPGKTWNEKLHPDNGLPKVVRIEGKRLRKFEKGTMVVPSPAEVDEIMRTVEKGSLITTDIIRTRLAKTHGTTTACPLTTGLFTIIAAFASEERAMEGRGSITPYWRTLKPGGELNAKYPGGIDNHRSLLEGEGHKVTQRKKKFFTENYEASLVDL